MDANEQRKWQRKQFIIAGVVIVAIIVLLVSCFSGGKSSSGGTVRCQVCGKSYQSGSENAAKIAYTNMCIKCYNNYKYAHDALKELPVD